MRWRGNFMPAHIEAMSLYWRLREAAPVRYEVAHALGVHAVCDLALQRSHNDTTMRRPNGTSAQKPIREHNGDMSHVMSHVMSAGRQRCWASIRR